MSNIRGEIGMRVRIARRLAGLSVRELAEQLGYLPITIYRWETGKGGPCIEDCERVATLASVELAWLVSGKGQARCA
jgi:transcriptional regulator with XRE-family HTH domain